MKYFDSEIKVMEIIWANEPNFAIALCENNFKEIYCYFFGNFNVKNVDSYCD